jgi:hypothetical protein
VATIFLQEIFLLPFEFFNMLISSDLIFLVKDEIRPSAFFRVLI